MNWSGFARAMREMAAPIDAGLSGETAARHLRHRRRRRRDIQYLDGRGVRGGGRRGAAAKHGNRSISSQCGSADLLESLGIDVTASPETGGAGDREVGIGFLFAPAMHTAMKHAQPVRVELKMRTVFNLLGPLTNPAGADAQLVGAPSTHAAELMAGALARLGTKRASSCTGRTAWTRSPPPDPPSCSRSKAARSSA